MIRMELSLEFRKDRCSSSDSKLIRAGRGPFAVGEEVSGTSIKCYEYAIGAFIDYGGWKYHSTFSINMLAGWYICFAGSSLLVGRLSSELQFLSATSYKKLSRSRYEMLLGLAPPLPPLVSPPPLVLMLTE